MCCRWSKAPTTRETRNEAATPHPRETCCYSRCAIATLRRERVLRTATGNCVCVLLRVIRQLREISCLRLYGRSHPVRKFNRSKPFSSLTRHGVTLRAARSVTTFASSFFPIPARDLRSRLRALYSGSQRESTFLSTQYRHTARAATSPVDDRWNFPCPKALRRCDVRKTASRNTDRQQHRNVSLWMLRKRRLDPL
jgi:hypothetical protein